MFKIIKNGVPIAITEKLNFIKQESNGIYYSCTESEAQGVSVKNKPYNLAGRKAMDGCETVIAVKIDGGESIFNGDNNQTETDALIVDHEYRLTLIEMGVAEI